MAHAGERQLWLDLQDESRAVISAAPAEAGDRRAAPWAVGISAQVFVAALPVAKVQIPAFPAFIAAYQSALFMGDLVTAALLFSQYAFLGSRPLLALATGYVFTAFMAVAHALTFPGLLAPAGLLGATPQTTAWMYMFWHAGFPALAIAYPNSPSAPAVGPTDHRVCVPVPVARKAPERQKIAPRPPPKPSAGGSPRSGSASRMSTRSSPIRTTIRTSTRTWPPR